MGFLSKQRRRRTCKALVCLTAVGMVIAACSSGHTAPTLSMHKLAAGLAGVGNLPQPASAWPEAGFDARYSSAATAVGPQTSHVRWHVRLDGDATPGPVIAADGSVLAATQSGHLYDLNSATGAVRWMFEGHGSYGTDLSTSPAVLGNGTILWPGSGNMLFALDSSGHLLWKHAFGAQVLSPAIAGHHRVYVADEKGTLLALNVSGTVPRIAWQLKVGGPDYASPSVGQDGTVYTAADQDLVAVRDLGGEGEVLWTLHTNDLVEVSNAVAPNGDVVLGTNNDREYGVTPAGHVAWSFDVGDNTYSSSAAPANGLTYFGDNTGRLHVLDARTGRAEHVVAPLGDGKEKIWTSAAIDSRGDFYWATTAGHVYGYDKHAKQLFHIDVGAGVNSYPAIGGNGALYLGTTSGTVYAIGA